MDGSPILDIKPYLPSFDRIENAIVPQWVMNEASLREVRFSDESLQELERLQDHFIYYKTSEEMKAVLTQVLSADVLFSMQENTIMVEHIVLTSEYEKENRLL